MKTVTVAIVAALAAVPLTSAGLQVRDVLDSLSIAGARSLGVTRIGFDQITRPDLAEKVAGLDTAVMSAWTFTDPVNGQRVEMVAGPGRKTAFVSSPAASVCLVSGADQDGIAARWVYMFHRTDHAAR